MLTNERPVLPGLHVLRVQVPPGEGCGQREAGELGSRQTGSDKTVQFREGGVRGEMLSLAAAVRKTELDPETRFQDTLFDNENQSPVL